MPMTLRLFDQEVAPTFLDWMAHERANGARLICLEGLSTAGKSYLMGECIDAGVARIELDVFRQNPAPLTISWIEQVIEGGAREAIIEALEREECVVVGGPAAWPVVSPVAGNLEPSMVRRVYLKGMSKTGDVVDWLAGTTLRPFLNMYPQPPYWDSIHRHHLDHEPWESADLVIGRVPEE